MSKERLTMITNALYSAGAKMKQGKIIHSSQENEARFNCEITWIKYTEERNNQKAKDQMNKEQIKNAIRVLTEASEVISNLDTKFKLKNRIYNFDYKLDEIIVKLKEE